MTIRTRTLVAVALALVLLPAAAHAQGWSVFKSDKFGFAMLVPPGTKLAGKDFGRGWGGLYAKTGAVEFLAIAKLGTFASPADIEAFGVIVTGIPARAWKRVDQGGSVNGWKWYRTYEARHTTGRLVYGIVGNGPKGSYLLLLSTTAADFAAKKPAYLAWYKSLTVY